MYLSAWDEEHFCILLETLSQMSLGKEKNTGEMRQQGDVLAEEQTGPEYYVYQLSIAFLEDQPFHLEETAAVDASTLHIIEQAQKAAEIIDHIE